MDTISPALANAFQLLRNELYGHLDAAELLAGDDWSDEDIRMARELIPNLVTVIRGVLAEHENRANGDCRICASPWPCPVVTTVHGLLKDPENQFAALVLRINNDD